MSRWWRAYDDALHDPKVQRLPPHLFKTWFNLLCVASKYEGVLPKADELAYLLRRRADDVRRDVAALCARCLFDVTADGIVPHNWNTRQYRSDLSTQRVRSHRKRSETVSGNVARNVSGTPPETETETETERSSLREDTRKRATRLADDWMPSEDDGRYAIEKGLTEAEAQHEFEKFRNYWQSKSGNQATKIDWSKTWRNWILTTIERKGRPNGNGRNGGRQTLSDLARDLADEARQREIAAGLGRPNVPVGSA
jgi:hypothetical protein